MRNNNFFKELNKKMKDPELIQKNMEIDRINEAQKAKANPKCKRNLQPIFDEIHNMKMDCK